MKTLFQIQKQYKPFSAIMQKISTDLLTKSARSPYSFPTVAKSTAGRGNPELSKANNSTPLNRAFFVRSLHTPKERSNKACSSMVACSGQGIALGCFSFDSSFPPRCTLSPYTVESVADSPLKFIKGLHKMNAFAYSFLCAIRTPETDTYQETIVRIIANSEVNARHQLSADYRLVLPRPVAKIRLNLTACTAQGGIYA